jgi:hypothetical protein
MNKITPNRIAIFKSEVMMKKASIVVVGSTAEAQRVVRRIDLPKNPGERVRDLTVSEQRDVQPEFRSLVQLPLRRWGASRAVLPFSEFAHRDRRFC